MNDRMKIFITRAVFADEFAVRMGSQINESIKWAIAQPIQWKVEDPDTMATEPLPAFSLRREEAQRFMDELWNAGIRPSEGSGSAGQAAAMKAHLDDMRKLVFTEPERRIEARA